MGKNTLLPRRSGGEAKEEEETLIEVSHLTKRYGEHTAVSDLSFTIEKGQIYGFLGPNGAGKSTTMNIMTGCLAATAGEVKIDGYDIFEQPMQAKRRIGYLPEQPPLYPDRTPKEYLEFVAEAKGVAKAERGTQIRRVMEQTGITDVAERLCKNLSKGYRQRVGIAQALLGEPEIIILDEPTVGLDPRQIIEIRDLIRSLGEKHTVILSSHILSEVQAVCGTILIIHKGKLVACDTPENLEKLFAGTATLELVTEADKAETALLLSALPGITHMNVRGAGENRSAVTLQTDSGAGEELCRAVFFAFAGAGKAILRMDMAKASLEDIFIELTGGETEEPGQTPSEEKKTDGTPADDAEGRESEGSGE